MIRHKLSQEQWELVKKYFAVRKGGPGRPPSDPKQIFDGIVWLARTGAPWRDMPEEFGPWETVYSYFARWRDNGTFSQAVCELQLELHNNGKIDWNLWCVDGSNTRATKAAAGAPKKTNCAEEPQGNALGYSRGGFGTKFHLLVDGTGAPLGVRLSAGQTHDAKVAPDLLTPEKDEQIWDLGKPDAMAGDKGYNSKKIRDLIKDMDIIPVIPTKSNQKRDPNFPTELYKKRNIVERVIGWLKEFRRVATRYEKYAVSYKAMIHIAFMSRYFRILGVT